MMAEFIGLFGRVADVKAASCQPSVDSCDDERPSISDGLCSIGG